ncbi:MAG: sigma-70 family RNA polymerase sigma factor [Acidobacteriaceae bacterium]|nr:sigma-70 family RNA polymerase sigma factor [Acidobacteriaceae bacterium]MBV9502673.1 sigma-70 family RNA polymerase sigma factor [Acidobacteriaceae bacterium]
MTETAEITIWLKAWAAGDRAALDRLMPVLYAEMHRLARRHMKHEQAGNSLQATVLINEAYLKLVNVGEVDWKDRAHFFAVSAQVMRRILVDAARTRSAAKRGGQARKIAHSSAVNFDEIADGSSRRAEEVIAVDNALAALAQLDARKAQVIEMRFFGGLSVEETAEVLGVSPQTVMRDWKLARAWLMRELPK